MVLHHLPTLGYGYVTRGEGRCPMLASAKHLKYVLSSFSAIVFMCLETS